MRGLRSGSRPSGGGVAAVVSGGLHHHLGLDDYGLHGRLHGGRRAVPAGRLLRDSGEGGCARPRRRLGAAGLVAGARLTLVNR